MKSRSPATADAGERYPGQNGDVRVCGDIWGPMDWRPIRIFTNIPSSIWGAANSEIGGVRKEMKVPTRQHRRFCPEVAKQIEFCGLRIVRLGYYRMASRAFGWEVCDPEFPGDRNCWRGWRFPAKFRERTDPGMCPNRGPPRGPLWWGYRGSPHFATDCE